MKRKVPIPLPQIPRDWWSDLRRGEKVNYSFDSLMFAFALVAPRMMDLRSGDRSLLLGMAIAFFIGCFIYSQIAERHFR